MDAETLFPVGTPAGEGHVVDREDYITSVYQRLLDGQSIMMSGPRRTGKSSVALEILRRLKKEGAYIAVVDLFTTASIEEMAAKLFHSILDNRTGVYRYAFHAVQSLKDRFEKAEFRAKLHDLELGLTLERSLVNPVDLLDAAITTAENLAKKDETRMVVLLDEFQEIERLGGDQLLKKLRALFQQQHYVKYLFLGSQTTLMNTLFSSRQQAFYRFATIMDLPDIPVDEWKRYIVEQLAAQNIQISSPAFSLLMQKTGGHPYCVMAVAYNAYLQTKLNGMTSISADVMHFAYEQSLTQLDGVYTGQLTEIHRFKHADAVLAAIIDGIPPYSLKVANAAIGKALAYLIRIAVITKGRHRGEYHLIEPLFGEWLVKRRNS